MVKLKINFFLDIVTIMLVYTSSAFGAAEDRVINRANAYYKKGDLDKAAALYDEAVRKKPDDALLNFNRAAVYYKKKDFNKSRESYHKSLATENKDFEAKASYNMGTVLYRIAEKKQEGDTHAALEFLKQSLGDFKRAIELDPKDNDAKYNYEVVSKKLKELSEQTKQERGEKSSGTDQNKEAQPQKSAEENKGASVQDQESNESKRQETEKEELEEQKAQKTEKQQQEETREGSAAEPLKEMTQEEAKMLIENFGQEGPRLELNDRHEPRRERPVEKDW